MYTVLQYIYNFRPVKSCLGRQGNTAMFLERLAFNWQEVVYLI